MRSLILAILVCTAPAFAGAYDDFGRGIDANNRGNPSAAERYFTAALLQGDLAPAYRPMAHLGRARAFLHDRHCHEAEDDLSDALKLKPDYVDAYNLRAETNHCLEHENAALADATAAIRLKPAAGYFYTRSRLYWHRSDFEDAHEDAIRALIADPGNSYFVLWNAVTGMRTGQPVRAELEAAEDTGGWPFPIIRLFLGKVSAEDVIRAADDRSDKLCEADFYIGQWRLAQGRDDEARTLFVRAQNECPRDFVAFEAATSELKRLP